MEDESYILAFPSEYEPRIGWSEETNKSLHLAFKVSPYIIVLLLFLSFAEVVATRINAIELT